PSVRFTSQVTLTRRTPVLGAPKLKCRHGIYRWGSLVFGHDASSSGIVEKSSSTIIPAVSERASDIGCDGRARGKFSTGGATGGPAGAGCTGLPSVPQATTVMTTGNAAASKFTLSIRSDVSPGSAPVIVAIS